MLPFNTFRRSIVHPALLILIAILAVATTVTLSNYTLVVTGFLPLLALSPPIQVALLTPSVIKFAIPITTPNPLRAFAAMPGESPPRKDAEKMKAPTPTISPHWFMGSAAPWA